MSRNVPRLLFVGAGNIAQSIIKGIVGAQPEAEVKILATAPSDTNLAKMRLLHLCETTLLHQAIDNLASFKPDFAFLCVKPQVLMASIGSNNNLSGLLKSIPSRCIVLSLLSGVERNIIASNFQIPEENIVRIMLNTAAEVHSTSVFYYGLLDTQKANQLNDIFSLIGQATVKLPDESLFDVATGLCGSGIAFFYEMIQTVSDIGVKNGLSRTDSTLAAAQLSKAAGEMILKKNEHPYKLRDNVTSPAGTTIYGLSKWHENGVNHVIGEAFQAAIDRAKHISTNSKLGIKKLE